MDLIVLVFVLLSTILRTVPPLPVGETGSTVSRLVVFCSAPGLQALGLSTYLLEDGFCFQSHKEGDPLTHKARTSLVNSHMAFAFTPWNNKYSTPSSGTVEKQPTSSLYPTLAHEALYRQYRTTPAPRSWFCPSVVRIL